MNEVKVIFLGLSSCNQIQKKINKNLILMFVINYEMKKGKSKIDLPFFAES
jgi:hypothetical protein